MIISIINNNPNPIGGKKSYMELTKEVKGSALIRQTTMYNQGKMTVRNASQEIREIFEVTGFGELINIE